MQYSLKEFMIAEVLDGVEKKWLVNALREYLIGPYSRKIVFMYRIAKVLRINGFNILSLLVFRRIQKTFGVYINPNADIGIGIKIPHPTGIVIGNGVKIGNNCTIFQNVTIGGARIGDAQNDGYPIISDNVVLFAGSKIIGKITVGSFAVVGGNSVVLKNVPPNSTVVGIPASVIRRNCKNAS